MPKQKVPVYKSSTLVQHIADTISDASTIRYCFILGAGASKSSGIRTGGELAELWFEDIKRLFPEEVDSWIKTHKITDTDLAPSYSEIYEKRFEPNPVEGYDFILQEIANSEPSYGYSILARVLGTHHNVVITTNFDPLTEDALFIYTENRPLVCGHESLSEFVRPTNARPVVIKVHRDQLLAPKSGTKDLSSLDRGFKESLDRILQTYMPIVIGYGGNDLSLMDYLIECSLINGIFWCKRPEDKLSRRITNLLEKKNGKIVEIPGFDEFMLQLNAAIFKDDPPLNEVLIDNAQRRGEIWGKQFAELTDKLKSIDSLSALSKIVKGKAFKNWWDVTAAANAEEDNEKKGTIYEKGFEAFKSAPIARGYALFLRDQRQLEKAEEYFLKTLELAPDDSFSNLIYGRFLADDRGKLDEGERYLKRSLEVDPEYYYANVNYAEFLSGHRKSYDLAEHYYLRAIELAPDDPFSNAYYADFLRQQGRDFDTAEKHYLKALEGDPENAYYQRLYATFLETIRNNLLKAEKHRQIATEIEASKTKKAAAVAEG